MKTFKEAAIYLGEKEDRPVANNTRIQKRGDNIAIKFHDTDIVVYHKDGSITINDGGWKTKTTKERIENFSPAIMGQENGIWYITTSTERVSYMYASGCIIRADRTIEGCELPSEEILKANRKELKEIREYCKGYIAKMIDGTLGAPGAGDCWYCGMQSDGISLGEKMHDDTHIISHIEEKYYVPSMVANAARAFGASPYDNNIIGAVFACNENDEAKKFIGKLSPRMFDSIYRILYRFVKRQLGYAGN